MKGYKKYFIFLLEVNKDKEKDRINTNFNIFDFTLYFKLCEIRNIEPLKISELE